jgi:hypothetical protein
MIRFCLLSLLLVNLMFCCFPPEEYFENVNAVPAFTIISGGDSLKSLTAKHKLSEANSYFQFYYSLSDDQEDEFQMVSISKSGVLENDAANELIRYYPSEYGFHSFDVVVKDPYGMSDKVHLNLDVFDNYKPVAIFDISVSGTVLKIDASNSYDQDSLYGGKIVSYRFTVNGNTWERESPILYHDIFSDIDYYNISLVVRDDDNALSEMYSQSYSKN